MRPDSPRRCHTVPLHTVHRVPDQHERVLTPTRAQIRDHRRTSDEETRVFIPVYARKAQKGHNGPRSQIGVYNEVSRGVE